MYALGALEPEKTTLASADPFLARSGAPLPETLDLRGELTAVRDQKNQGSCVAFAASCVMEYFARRSVGARAWFSPQFIYNNRKNFGSGMRLADAVDIMKRLGVAQERVYNYGTIEPASLIPDHVLKDAQDWRIYVGEYITTIDQTKRALLENGPCIISFPVYNYSGEFWNRRSPNETRLGGHCVAIVGYTKDGFILRNSWGEKWNGDGHTIFKYSDFGKQWEIWTMIDLPPHPQIPDYPKKSGFRCCC